MLTESMVCYKNFDLQFVYGPSIFYQHNLKLSIVTLNIFINLTLFKVIFLTNFTCLGKRLILFIFLNGSYLWSMLDTVLSFPFFRTILKNSTSNVSFFTRFLCIFCDIQYHRSKFCKKDVFSKSYNGLPHVSVLAISAIRAQYYWFCH